MGGGGKLWGKRKKAEAEEDKPDPREQQGPDGSGKRGSRCCRLPQFHLNCRFPGLYRLYPGEQGAGLQAPVSCRERLRRQLVTAFMLSDWHPMGRLFARTNARLTAERRRHAKSDEWFVVHPFSLLRLVWDPVMAGLLLASLLIYPSILAFGGREFETNCSLYMLDFFCFADVVLRFFTGYVQHMFIVMELKLVIGHYLRSYFVVDMLGSLPWETVFCMFQNDTRRGPGSLFRLLTVLKLVRLRPLLAYCGTLAQLLRIGRRVSRVIRFGVLTVVLAHWGVCAQLFLPRLLTLGLSSDQSESNISVHRHDTDYYFVFFEGTSQLLGMEYGPKVPRLTEDQLSAIVVIFVSGVWRMCALVLFAQVLNRLASSGTKYETMTRQLGAYMAHKQLPVMLQRRIMTYYEYRYQKMYFKDRAILASLTERLRQEVVLHQSRRLVSNVEIFRHLPMSVMSRIAPCLKPDVYLPNDVITKAGSEGDRMYFLSSGTVALFTRTGREICHLHDGTHFGEVVVVLKDERRNTTATAVEVCEVYSLERADFERVIVPFRELYRGIERVARARVERATEFERAIEREQLASERPGPEGGSPDPSDSLSPPPDRAAAAGPTAGAGPGRGSEHKSDSTDSSDTH